MSISVIKMTENDRKSVLEMMRVFYASPAVNTNGSEKIFNADIDACVGDGTYAEGYVFIAEGAYCGYGMIAKSFSTEFGKQCIWIEDLYVLPDYRKRGIGFGFLEYIKSKYPDALIRLEAEKSNFSAVSLYKKFGFNEMGYMELYM